MVKKLDDKLLYNSIVLGIDPSINSTGICVMAKDEEGNIVDKPIYYLIGAKFTKKQKLIKHPRVKLYEYEHKSYKDLKSWEKERCKSENVYNIVQLIKLIISSIKPNKIYMEGVAYAANGTIDQLAGLNYSIRNLAIDNNIDIVVVPPTTIKNLVVGNGQATKDIIIETWSKLDPSVYNAYKDTKIDDLADAYMMASLVI